MSRWTTQFEEHKIHETLDNLIGKVTGVGKNVSENEFEERRRIIKIANALKEVLDSVDPELCPPKVLNNLNNKLADSNNGILPFLNNYESNGNVVELERANNNFVHLFHEFAQLAASIAPYGYKNNISSYESEFDNLTSGLIQSNNQALKDIEKLKADIAGQSQSVKKIASDIDNFKKSTTDLLSDWQQQFSDAQQDRANQYNTALDTFKTKSDNDAANAIKKANDKLTLTIDSTNAETSELTAGVRKQLDQLRNDAKLKHSEILDLYELVAGDSVSGNFTSAANKEQKSANLWRWISIGFLVLSVLWLAIVYFSDAGFIEGDNINWARVLTGLSLTSILITGFGFAARQAGQHRRRHASALQFALQVKAFDPFIRNLDEESQKQLKSKFVETIFSKEEISAEGVSADVDIRSLERISKVFTDFAKILAR